ncbi:MAG: hypothetical protein JWO30_3291 [Fibrobacteres bacterium]|nr:hypothetical protein [Fibrobacterota bacterium]
MNRFLQVVALGIFAATAPLKASPGSAMLEERYKAALNDMVQEVRNTPDPAAKRQILEHFITHMSQGLEKAEAMQSISEQDRASLHSVLGKFYAYDSELKGMPGFAPVADANLDGFAGYIQQGMEQAPVGGGIYLSGGAIIIILLILLLLIR